MSEEELQFAKDQAAIAVAVDDDKKPFVSKTITRKKNKTHKMQLSVRKEHIKIKVFLDDERNAPDESWVTVRTPKQAIALLATGMVSEISLDHDLGDDENVGTGYDVVLWLEEKTFFDISFLAPDVMKVHSANVSARVKMEQGLENVRKIERRDFRKKQK